LLISFQPPCELSFCSSYDSFKYPQFFAQVWIQRLYCSTVRQRPTAGTLLTRRLTLYTSTLTVWASGSLYANRASFPTRGLARNWTVENMITAVESTARVGNWSEADKISIPLLKLKDVARLFFNTPPVLQNSDLTWQPFRRRCGTVFRTQGVNKFIICNFTVLSRRTVKLV
jgi:hypothetical protein